MTRLLDSRRGVFVRDAARRLSTDDQKVSEADLLRMGLDGDLPLSVKFVDKGKGRVGERVAREGPKVRGKGKTRQRVEHLHVSEDHVLQFEEPLKLLPIDEIWDLAMLRDERLEVQRQYNQLAIRSSDQMLDPTGVFLMKHPDGRWCQLYKLDSNTPFISYSPANRLPDDADLVVRTATLDALEVRFGKSSGSDRDTPLNERERLSLLRIIRALAGETQIDISQPTKAAEQISALTAEIDSEKKVGVTTISNHLRRIKDDI